MREIINKILKVVQWPLAAYLALSIPAYVASFDYFRFMQPKFWAFGSGFIGFYFIRTFSDKSIRAGMQTLAHEFTHAFFAAITGHKIKHLRLNPDDSGGAMAFAGEGNWLILAGPYFFPLFIMLYMLAAALYAHLAGPSLFLNGILGYLLGYHLDMIQSQTHAEQTDLQKLGFGFCWAFLPGANLWVAGNVLAFNSKMFAGMAAYNGLIWDLNVKFLREGLSRLF